MRGYKERAHGRLAALRQSSMEMPMARKHLTVGEFALFNVLYEDGTQSSNRKVPLEVLGGIDGDDPARDIIEEQDRKIGEASGRSRPKIKSIARAGAAARRAEGRPGR
jgi:hypothetical protein